MRMSHRDKYYCQFCDWVTKTAHTPTCPICREPMTFMTDKWRPGRKNSKTRLWDKRVPQHRRDAARLTSGDLFYRTKQWVRYSGVTEEWIRSRMKDD